MSLVPWTHPINFASALLLHSCITILLKETLNALTISFRLIVRCWRFYKNGSVNNPQDQITTSVVLDAYTSIFSCDQDGELAELYFTNTGFILLAISLASSVAMNMLLSDFVLNMLVAATFGMAFVASLFNNGKTLTLPIMALRRAGRFIWSDTPFVNFFSLIYIATVLHGQSTLRLQDYVTFRTIAVLELVFMKGKLAASNPEKQVDLMRRLLASEWTLMEAHVDDKYLESRFAVAERNNMVPFTTQQRLSVMLFKTGVGFHYGCVQGSMGPARCPQPDVGCRLDEMEQGWKIYRMSEDIMIVADAFAQSHSENPWSRFIARAHGVLLRRLGKIRVIYLVRQRDAKELGNTALWHSNINLVTGVNQSWLESNFRLGRSQMTAVVAGN